VDGPGRIHGEPGGLRVPFEGNGELPLPHAPVVSCISKSPSPGRADPVGEMYRPILLDEDCRIPNIELYVDGLNLRCTGELGGPSIGRRTRRAIRRRLSRPAGLAG